MAGPSIAALLDELVSRFKGLDLTVTAAQRTWQLAQAFQDAAYDDDLDADGLEE